MLGEEGWGKWDVHFLGVYHDSDGNWMDEAKDLITGRVLTQWWGRADESGPAARVAETFSLEQPTLECLTISEGQMKLLASH